MLDGEQGETLIVGQPEMNRNSYKNLENPLASIAVHRVSGVVGADTTLEEL